MQGKVQIEITEDGGNRVASFSRLPSLARERERVRDRKRDRDRERKLDGTLDYSKIVMVMNCNFMSKHKIRAVRKTSKLAPTKNHA